MASIPDWITAIASAVAAGAVLIGFFHLKASVGQLNATLQQMSADHERSRREKAVDLLSQWSANLNRRGSIARKFVETLDFDNAKCLFHEDPIKGIDIKHKDLLIGCFSKIDPQIVAEWEKNGTIALSSKESAELRWEVVSYLNTLETIFVAWRHNVADRGIISEQFRYLVSKENNHAILSNFRQAAGGRASYPAIDDFVKNLAAEKDVPGKSQIA